MDWEKYYTCDPHNFTDIREDDKALIVGGQANIWAEFADTTNVISRLWPRASAVAERLWSQPNDILNIDDARHRLDNHRCRMVRRGIPASPILNGYCGAWEIKPEQRNFADPLALALKGRAAGITFPAILAFCASMLAAAFL